MAGPLRNTNRDVVEGVATVRVDERQSGESNQQVTIHVEHPDHAGDARAFWRRRDGDVAGSIRSHLRTELDDDLARVEVIDEAGLGLSESELLPRRMARERPGSPATEVEVRV